MPFDVIMNGFNIRKIFFRVVTQATAKENREQDSITMGQLQQ